MRGRYEGFDEFLKEAIREYYQRSFRSHKGTFIALLVSSGQVTSLARDRLMAKGAEGAVKKVALGAGLLVALRIGLGFALSGPLGVLVTAGTAASILYYAARHQGEIVAKHARVKALLEDARRRYEELQGSLRGGHADEAQRDLMIDGLLLRLLADLDSV